MGFEFTSVKNKIQSSNSLDRTTLINNAGFSCINDSERRDASEPRTDVKVRWNLKSKQTKLGFFH